MADSISWGVEQALASDAVARYYYNQSYLKKFTMSKGDFSFTKENLFDSEKLPNKFYVILMDTQSVDSPTYKKNPLIMKDFKLKRIECKLNSQNIGQNYDDLDMSSTKYRDLYCAFINSLKSFQRPMRTIEYSKYGQGRTIMAFKLSDEAARDDVITESLEGRVSLELYLKEAAQNPINIYIYYKRNHLCSIFGKDKNSLEVSDTLL